jgi:hypothetical protein
MIPPITPPCYPTDPSDRPWLLLRCHVTMQTLYSRHARHVPRRKAAPVSHGSDVSVSMSLFWANARNPTAIERFNRDFKGALAEPKDTRRYKRAVGIAGGWRKNEPA